mgnify:CR=1 FL=1
MRVPFAIAALLFGILLASGCRTRPWELEEFGTGTDLNVSPDFTLPRDLAVPPDLRPPPDLTLPFVCRDIYVVDENGTFSGFDPLTATFFDVRKLNCPSNSSPQTMSVARDGRAWVFYSDGSLFYVDIRTGVCSASTFDRTQIDSNTHFGSSFSADQPGGNTETPFLALPDDGVFARIDPATLKVARFGMPGVIPQTGAELTGTAAAELWGFFPSQGSSYIARIDKTTGTQDSRFNLPQINTDAAGFAFAFWGGSFWIFLYDASIRGDTNVYRLDKATGKVDTVLKSTGRHIVGAGVASCAPLGLDH